MAFYGEIDNCPECDAAVTDLAGGGTTATDLFARGVDKDRVFSLEPCGHSVTGGEIELRKNDDVPRIRFHRA